MSCFSVLVYSFVYQPYQPDKMQLLFLNFLTCLNFMVVVNFGIFMQTFDLNTFMFGVLNLAKPNVFKLSIVHVSSNCVTFLLKNGVFCLIRLVSNLFCAYYIVQVWFVSASILYWNISDQRLTTFGWFSVGSRNFNVS